MRSCFMRSFTMPSGALAQSLDRAWRNRLVDASRPSVLIRPCAEG